MGKRKRRSDQNKTPPPSDVTPNAPLVDLQLEQRSHQAESSSLKTPPSDELHLNQNHGSHRATLLRHPRYSCGLQYSRRSSNNHCDPSPSHWKATPVNDAKLSFKLANRDVSEFPYRERWERAFHKPERIRSSSLMGLTTVPANVREMECGICQKRLRKNPVIIDNSMISSNDHTVVAILVCGHAYHAECLEQKTNHEDRQDPPCPFCASTTI